MYISFEYKEGDNSETRCGIYNFKEVETKEDIYELLYLIKADILDLYGILTNNVTILGIVPLKD